MKICFNHTLSLVTYLTLNITGPNAGLSGIASRSCRKRLSIPDSRFDVSRPLPNNAALQVNVYTHNPLLFFGRFHGSAITEYYILFIYSISLRIDDIFHPIPNCLCLHLSLHYSFKPYFLPITRITISGCKLFEMDIFKQTFGLRNCTRPPLVKDRLPTLHVALFCC